MKNPIFDSAACRLDLTSTERDILWLIIRRFNGKNNGAIPLGSREAAKHYGWSQSTASRAMQRLEKSPLVTLTHKGHTTPEVGRNIASRWRLNFRINTQG
jgi:DNA-binding MarR family transcriptional regulator